MSYTENYKGIKLDIQAVDMQVSESVQETVKTGIDKLSKYVDHINFADVYLKVENAHSLITKSVSFRLGIPGPDVFAEATGEHFEPIIRQVVEKLERQLKKHKA